jgi:TetR/AcrR family transcriptional regulator, cholesterol catabolism regulator
MAKTKTDLDRDQKRADILRVARRLFLEDGYEATSIHRIAEEMRVAPNTLYWYFKDKDALLIAVLDVLVSEALHEFERRKKASLEAQLLWVLGVLSGAQRVITTVHARMASAEGIRAWHEGLHTMIEATIERQLRASALAPGHEAHAARTTMFVIEGLLAHPSTQQQQRSLVKWLVSLVQNRSTQA